MDLKIRMNQMKQICSTCQNSTYQEINAMEFIFRTCGIALSID